MYASTAIPWAHWLRLLVAPPGDPDLETIDEDAAWLADAGRGDGPALQQLFDKWKLPLLSFFYRSLGSRPDAEDLTLEVFVRVHRSANRYRRSAKFSTFLFHIARNLLLNELRRRKRKPTEHLPSEVFEGLSADPDAGTRRLAELEEVFQRALERLPEKYRTPLLLLKQQRMDYAETAATLEMTENALRVLVHRGRQLLRTEMETLQ